jgi:hypothetical protein
VTLSGAQQSLRVAWTAHIHRFAGKLRLRLASVAAAITAWACLDPAGAPNALPPGGSLAILEENLRPGSDSWDTPNTAPDSALSGFGLPFSLQRGDTLHLFVRALRPPVSIAIYRMGWYGGSGARRIAQHDGIETVTQGACTTPVPGPLVCNWNETDRFAVTLDWIPGVYVAEFSDSLGRVRAFPFVVRSARPATFVVVLPFATYQAYNPWGGASLYGGVGATREEIYANRAVQVSYARPYSDPDFESNFLGIDYLLVRWLERHDYDVSYITDYDFHLGRGVEPQTAWLFAGHSEYWTWSMWQRANASRDAGISLGFLGGNDIYWMARFESGQMGGLDAPTVVCYRDASLDPDGATPGLATVLFRSPPNNTPENSLMGVMSGPFELMRTPPVDLVVANDTDPMMAGTGLQIGEHIPRVAGWEADRIIDNGHTPPGIRTLFQSPYVPMWDSTATETMHMTIYAWPASGAEVFAAGEPGFAWGLETFRSRTARPQLERLLQNVLDEFVAAR